MEKKKKISTGKPFDDVFRTMITDSSRFAVSLINEMFGKHISLDAEMISHQNEMYLADNEERISDSNRQFGQDQTHYHTECESVAGDSGILIRLFEYGSKMALGNRQLEGNTLYVTFPMTGVLYLRDSVSTPNEMRMVVRAPDSEEALHLPVSVMKLGDYSLEEIINKNLWFLFPFYIFHYENRLNSKVPERIEQAESDALIDLGRIKAELDRLNKDNKIEVFERRLAERMILKVLGAVAFKSDRIMKGADAIMGGQVLDYEEKRILNKGVEQGQDILVLAIQELKAGKTPDELYSEGFDDATVQRAMSCL